MLLFLARWNVEPKLAELRVHATPCNLVELTVAVPEEASRRRSSQRPFSSRFPKSAPTWPRKNEIGAKTKAAAPPIGSLRPSGTIATRSSTMGESVRYTGRTRALKLYVSNLIPMQ